MSRASHILREIKHLERDITHQKKILDSELVSPDCYALPLAAFFVGLVLQRYSPPPFEIITQSIRLMK